MRNTENKAVSIFHYFYNIRNSNDIFRKLETRKIREVKEKWNHCNKKDI